MKKIEINKRLSLWIFVVLCQNFTFNLHFYDHNFKVVRIWYHPLCFLWNTDMKNPLTFFIYYQQNLMLVIAFQKHLYLLRIFW